MKRENRITLSIFAFITSYYCIYWLPFTLILGPAKYDFIARIISLLIPLVIAIYLWKKGQGLSDTLATYIIMGGAIAGAIGFVLGFVGPMLLWPDANQGPLLGIFITGPIGFLIGLLGGGLFGWLKLKNR